MGNKMNGININNSEKLSREKYLEVLTQCILDSKRLAEVSGLKIITGSKGKEYFDNAIELFENVWKNEFNMQTNNNEPLEIPDFNPFMK